jgi:hypothetical protein
MAQANGPWRSIAESALEAWVDCGPEGYVLDKQRLLELLPTIAAHVPNRSPGARVKELSRLFADTDAWWLYKNDLKSIYQT